MVFEPWQKVCFRETLGNTFVSISRPADVECNKRRSHACIHLLLGLQLYRPCLREPCASLRQTHLEQLFFPVLRARARQRRQALLMLGIKSGMRLRSERIV